MPTAARRPCTWPGCPKLASTGSRCDQHRKQSDRERGTAHERGYTSAWTKARDAFLAKHPLCERCKPLGIIEAAQVVDHKIPHQGDKALFWDRDNWQALSKRCHDRKTASEDGGFGR